MSNRSWLLIAIIFCGFAEVLSLAPVSDLSLCLIEEQHNEKATNHDGKKRCPAFHVGAALAFEKADSLLEHHDKSVVGGFTIVLAVSTIGLWMATNRLWAAGERQIELLRESSEIQSTQMQESIRAARDSANAAMAFRETDRAWMVLQNIATVAFSDGTIDGIPVKSGVMIQVVWINKGRSPAISAHVFIDYRIIPDEENVLPIFGGNLPSVTGSLAVGPDQTAKSGYHAIGDEITRDLFERRSAIAIYSRITYKDIFNSNVERTGEVCAKATFGGMVSEYGSTVQKPSWNYAILGPQNTTT